MDIKSLKSEQAVNWSKRIHICSLILFIANLFSGWIFDFSFIPGVNSWFKFFIISTGIHLFIIYLSPFKAICLYYIFYPVLFFFFFMGGGIMTMFMGNNGNRVRANEDNIRIYGADNGLFSICCSYRVTETFYGIFEKELTILEVAYSIDLANVYIKNFPDRLEVDYDAYIYSDSLQAYDLKPQYITIEKK